MKIKNKMEIEKAIRERRDIHICDESMQEEDVFCIKFAFM